MHSDDIQREPNLYDSEKPEEFLYDAELLNAWFWEKFLKELL